MGRGSRTGRKLALAIACALAACAVLAAVASADFPYAPGGNPHDYSTFHISPPTKPSDYDLSNFKGLATPEPGNEPINSQQDQLCGIRGDSLYDTAASVAADGSACPAHNVHTAWNVTTGRPDVLISVLDSGIEWNNVDAMNDLRAKVHLNQGELPKPRNDLPNPIDSGASTCSGFNHASGSDYDRTANFDANGDGVFNALDYECDSRVAAVVNGGSARHADRHGPAGTLTPEDLILAFSDGTDHDGNGFANDIAGWDFVDNKNNPYDDVQYGHGTGEARDSNAEANNGGDVGTCPNCQVLPLRVGESFVADANRFAQATVYATDMGTDVVQEALGTLNAPNFARQAIDYAYNHGVTVIASGADEAAEHHNEPGSLPHTIDVNSVTKYDSTFTPTYKSYLQFNGCTNFSTRITVSVPSTSCSSEATGRSAGIAGLIYSAAMNEHAAHPDQLGNSSDCHRVDGSPCLITPDEVRQLMASGHIGSSDPADQGNGGQADDVNFAAQPEGSCASASVPTCTDPNSNTLPAPDPEAPLGAVGPDAVRYPARKGFDEFYGYGRLNADRAVSAAGSGQIPPEADITSPDWFQQMDPGKPDFAIGGLVNARSDYTCRVEVAPGGQPNNSADFHAVSSDWCDGSTTRSGVHQGTLATVSTTQLKSYFPSGNPSSWGGNQNGGTAQTSNGRPNTMPYAFTVRVVVTTVNADASKRMTGEDRRQLFLHRDQDMLNSHFPMETHSDGDSSPLLVDLNGDNRNELVVANSDGVIHAYRPDGSELPGWPVHADSLPLHGGERAYTAGDGVGAGHYNAILGALAAGDLFHDGRTEIVADDNGGNVYAWDASGHQVFHQQSNPNYSGAPLASSPFRTIRNGPRDRTERGFLASPVVADLGDGKGMDIVAAGDDRHVYAWHGDGSAVNGFPLPVYDHSKASVDSGTTNHLTFNSSVNPNPGIDEDQGKIIDTPAVAHLNGADKPPSVILGTNEEYPVGSGPQQDGDMNAGGLNAASLGAIGASGVLSYANGRVYAIKSDGDAGGNPYESGWPKKVGIIDAGLLPDVGEGVNGSPVTAPVTCPSGGGGMKVGVVPDAGPAYIFNADGSSCYGQTNGDDNTLQTDATAGFGQTDHPTFGAVGYPAFGTLDGQTTSFFTPVAGIVRALDVVAPEYQKGGQDFIGGWNPNVGQALPGYPTPVNDLQFLTGPAVGDVTGGGNGAQQVLGGTASLDLAAVGAGGTPASSAWPKLTGDWTVATPTLGSFGTLDTDSGAKKDVVSITRSGTLAVYSTPAAACSPSSSPRFHHDDANSGDYTRDAVPPGVPTDAAVSGGALTFKAPGDDLLCGTATRYEIATSNGAITPQSFASATQLAAPPAPAAAGTAQSYTLPAGTGRYVAVRAVDDQGNLGLPAVVDTRPGGGPGSPGGLGGNGNGNGPPAGVPPSHPRAPGGCADTRKFRFGLHHARRMRITKVVVYVNGRRRMAWRGHNIRSITLAKLPRSGNFTVKIDSSQSSGGVLESVRRYQGCRKTSARTRRLRSHGRRR